MEWKEYWDGKVRPDVGTDGEAEEEGRVKDQPNEVPDTQVVLRAPVAQLPTSAGNEVDIRSGSVWKTHNVTASRLGQMSCVRVKPEEKADDSDKKVEPDCIEA